MLKRILSYLLWLFALVGVTPSSADFMQVHLLGTGTPQPSAERFGAATLVAAGGRYFLFDAGRGVTIRLQQAAIPLAQVDHVFITHLHSDHITGLPDLWLTGWIWQRPSMLELIGPAGVQEMSEHLMRAYQNDLRFRSLNTGLDIQRAQIKAREIKPGVVYKADGVTITAFLVNHQPVEPAFGYRIDFGDRSVVISGDTTISDNLIKNARGCDVLVHEVAMATDILLERNSGLQKVMQYHTTPEQLADVFKQVQPRLGVMTHILKFGVSDEDLLKKVTAIYDGKIELGHDLMKIEIGSQVQVIPSTQVRGNNAE